MQAILEFHGILKKDGSEIIQQIPCDNPAILQDRVKLTLHIQNLLVTLGIGGMVHKDGNRMRLRPGELFAEIWCEVPSIILADSGQTIAGPNS
jgi:hypothetical protein